MHQASPLNWQFIKYHYFVHIEDAGSSGNLREGESKLRNAATDEQVRGVCVCVLNPLASSHQSSTIQAIYKSQEQEKKRAYEQRIREIEYRSFTPPVMSMT